MKPGDRLRRIARRLCSKATMDRLVDPVIGDLQLEYEDAIGRGTPWRARRTLLMGYLAFWKVAVYCVVAGTRRTGRSGTPSAMGRPLLYVAVAMSFLTAVLVADPLLSGHAHGRVLWLFVLLLPQSLPLTIPFGILVGTLSALRLRKPSMRVRGMVVAIGLVGSLVSWIAIAWLLPAANQAFLETVAGRVVARGPAETSLGALRQEAVDKKREGKAVQAGQLFMAYHQRLAVVGTATVFAVFGLGVIALRVGRVATAGIGLIGPALYIAYLFELSNAEVAVFSDERIAIALAWLPNVALLLTSAVFMSARHGNSQDQAADEKTLLIS